MTRVLVVDDGSGVRFAVSELLTGLGYQVRGVESGLAACDLPSSAAFDVLLCDQRLPDITGVELLAVLGRRWPEAAAILMSGYTEDGLARGRVAAGTAILDGALHHLRASAHRNATTCRLLSTPRVPDAPDQEEYYRRLNELTALLHDRHTHVRSSAVLEWFVSWPHVEPLDRLRMRHCRGFKGGPGVHERSESR